MRYLLLSVFLLITNIVVCGQNSNNDSSSIQMDSIKEKLLGSWLSYQNEAYSILFNYEQGFTLKKNHKYTNITRTSNEITVNDDGSEETGIGFWNYLEGDTLQFTDGHSVLNYEILSLTDSILEIRDYQYEPNHYILQRYETSTTSVGLKKKEKFSLTLDVFPNPTNGIFTLSPDGEYVSYRIEIYNTQGDIVYNTVRSRENLTIDLTGMEKGAYVVKVKAGNWVKTGKLVIN